MSGYEDKVREEIGLMERILRYIPGYRGYKEKEIRRESDRLIRMESSIRLQKAKDTLRSSLANPYIVQKLSGEDMWMTETLLSRLDRIKARIEKAVAGYAGIFDAIKVREDKLDKLLEHDLKLIEAAENVKALAERMASEEAGEENWRKIMEDMLKEINRLDSLVDERTEILRGLASEPGNP